MACLALFHGRTITAKSTDPSEAEEGSSCTSKNAEDAPSVPSFRSRGRRKSWHVPDRTNLDCADFCTGDLGRSPDRLIEVFCVDQKVSGELFMRFCVRTVRHDRLLVTNADTRGRGGRFERCSEVMTTRGDL